MKNGKKTIKILKKLPKKSYKQVQKDFLAGKMEWKWNRNTVRNENSQIVAQNGPK